MKTGTHTLIRITCWHGWKCEKMLLRDTLSDWFPSRKMKCLENWPKKVVKWRKKKAQNGQKHCRTAASKIASRRVWECNAKIWKKSHYWNKWWELLIDTFAVNSHIAHVSLQYVLFTLGKHAKWNDHLLHDAVEYKDDTLLFPIAEKLFREDNTGCWRSLKRRWRINNRISNIIVWYKVKLIQDKQKLLSPDSKDRI